MTPERLREIEDDEVRDRERHGVDTPETPIVKELAAALRQAWEERDRLLAELKKPELLYSCKVCGGAHPVGPCPHGGCSCEAQLSAAHAAMREVEEGIVHLVSERSGEYRHLNPWREFDALAGKLKEERGA